MSGGLVKKRLDVAGSGVIIESGVALTAVPKIANGRWLRPDAGEGSWKNGAPRFTPLSWASGFDGHAQELRECSATLERAFADVERANLGPGLFDDFPFLIDLLVAQSAFGFLLQFEPNFDYRHVPILRAA